MIRKWLDNRRKLRAERDLWAHEEAQERLLSATRDKILIESIKSFEKEASRAEARAWDNWFNHGSQMPKARR